MRQPSFRAILFMDKTASNNFTALKDWRQTELAPAVNRFLQIAIADGKIIGSNCQQ
jgi:hypothetical protein